MQSGGSDGANVFEELMVKLDGADPETVNRIAWERSSLPVRLAMLGLAAAKPPTSTTSASSKTCSLPAPPP